jgi:hypothetical protein
MDAPLIPIWINAGCFSVQVFNSIFLVQDVLGNQRKIVDLLPASQVRCYHPPKQSLISCRRNALLLNEIRHYGGWGGIRTRGTFRYTRFPGVPNRPLWHPSCRSLDFGFG